MNVKTSLDSIFNFIDRTPPPDLPRITAKEIDYSLLYVVYQLTLYF